jgi:beta-lactamase class A
MDRRTINQALLGAFAALAGTGFAAGASATDLPGKSSKDTATRLREIEKASGGRLGVAVLNIHTGQRFSHRGGERFPLCSTFKLLAAALVLHRVDNKQESLERSARYSAVDLVDYSPVTEPKVGAGSMRVDELCEAMVTLSDNTAANLMLRDFGGPAALTAWLRSLGDKLTRLDRNEPTLNEARPGDPRDTTTPDAMLQTLNRILLGDALLPASRQQMLDWLRANKTGDKRLRAGLPAGWSAGEKTGSGANGSHNDIGLLWTPAQSPVIVCAYLTGTKASAAVRDDTLAEVARLVVSAQAG